MDKIIFLTPFFGNTGSEIALFNFIVRIKDYEVIVVSKERGELFQKLPRHIKFYDYATFCRENKLSEFVFRVRNKLRGVRASYFHHFLDSVLDTRRALFYVNTVFMPDVVSYLCRRKLQFILHSHELQHMFVNLKRSDLVNIVEGAEYIFTSSRISKQLLRTLGRKKRIEHCYPGINVKSFICNTNSLDVKKQLNVPLDAFVIAMSGTLNVNKNPEVFLQVGGILRKKGLNIRLLWIGAGSDDGYMYYLQKKADEDGLANYCTWMPPLKGSAYYDMLNVADCFVLTSYQESFSIVLIEALALGKPVFSFKSGGPQEIIDSRKIGVLIDDYSAEEMSKWIEKLILGEISFDSSAAVARANEFCAERGFRQWFERVASVGSSIN